MSILQGDETYAPNLLLGLEGLWREQIFVDTTLVFGNYEVKVHRAVLAAASQYFKSMFAGSLKESWSHERIEIHEVDPHIVEKLIEYSYTGKIEINQENVLKILQTVDLLQFDSVSQNLEKKTIEEAFFGYLAIFLMPFLNGTIYPIEFLPFLIICTTLP